MGKVSTIALGEKWGENPITLDRSKLRAFLFVELPMYKAMYL